MDRSSLISQKLTRLRLIVQRKRQIGSVKRRGRDRNSLCLRQHRSLCASARVGNARYSQFEICGFRRNWTPWAAEFLNGDVGKTCQLWARQRTMFRRRRVAIRTLRIAVFVRDRELAAFGFGNGASGMDCDRNSQSSAQPSPLARVSSRRRRSDPQRRGRRPCRQSFHVANHEVLDRIQTVSDMIVTQNLARASKADRSRLCPSNTKVFPDRGKASIGTAHDFERPSPYPVGRQQHSAPMRSAQGKAKIKRMCGRPGRT